MASPDTDEDFRRRRLSLPLSEMMDGEDHDETTASSPTARTVTTTLYKMEAHRSTTPPPPQPPLEDCSFRKRRLSWTNVTSHTTLSPSSPQQVVSPSPIKKKPCRVVVDPTTTTTHENKSNLEVSHRQSPPPPPLLPSRILHSAELHDDDTVSFSSNVFYHGSQHHQPQWKRRMTLNAISDADKLPFPPDIVGTYSYHGVEPAYEDDDDEEQPEEEEEETPNAHKQGISPSDARVPNLHQLMENSSPVGGLSFLFAAAAGAEETTTLDGDDIPGVVPSPSDSIAKINQDRGGVVYPYANSSTTALFAVYDGHGQGGELVSQFALSEIQQRLGKHPMFRTNMTRAFSDTFRDVDEALHNEPLIEPLFAGTTACVALLDGRNLYTANLGDSRAVCARRRCSNSCRTAKDDHDYDQRYQAIDLTVDQNPDVPSEQRRIEAAGGHVTPPPAPGLSARVWLDAACTQVGLAMARSLGDHAAATVGVIAEPVTTVRTIDPQDEFLILATDGVWEFISSQQAVEIVQGRIEEGATVACQALIQAAAKRWQEEEGSYRDDITAIVVQLQCLWDFETTL